MSRKDLKVPGALICLAIGLMACQASPAAEAATPVNFPTQTASPIPPSATPSPKVTATQPSPTPTATLAPFPEAALAGNEKFSSLRKIAFNSAMEPLAIAPYEHFYFSHPVPVNYLGERVPSSRYGNDQHAENGAGHTGLDLGLDHGTPILASAEGEVIFSGYGLLTRYENPDDPYGLAIVIQHDFGYDGQPLYTVYAHLSQALVEEGQRVERGEEIGRSGNTGFSSGPHIHFEVRLNLNTHDNSRNPELWIRPLDGEGVLVGTMFNTFGVPMLGASVQLTHVESGRIRWAYSYLKSNNITADDFFGENFVFSELPVGIYEVAVYYITGVQRTQMIIKSGQVSYFTFNGANGFDLTLPEIASPPNIPQ